MTTADELRRVLLTKAFRMPLVQSMVDRKSSITNAFVNAVIPVIAPSHEEIDEALQILEQDPSDLRCTYCGDRASEWDHLRPLVLNRRPTGFISEIANLVPSCGKCNQSKGNKPWRTWMLSNSKWSPTGKAVADVPRRIALLERFEQWRSPTQVDFAAVVGQEEWESYWGLCEAVNCELRQAQEVANGIQRKVVAAAVGQLGGDQTGKDCELQRRQAVRLAAPVRLNLAVGGVRGKGVGGCLSLTSLAS